MDPLLDPRVAALPPAQRAQFDRVDKEAKNLIQSLTGFFNTHHYSPEGALAGLAGICGAVIRNCPQNIKIPVFTGFCQGVRETAFDETIIASGAPGLFVPPPSKKT